MSLLFLEEGEKTIPVHPDCYRDLAVEELVNAITGNTGEQEIIRNVFTKIPASNKTVTYRQEILNDFLSNEELCTGLNHVLSKLKVLKDYKTDYRGGGISKASVWELIDFLQQLEVYVAVIEEMNEIFKDKKLQSEALKQVAETISTIMASGGISQIKEDVKELRADISTTRSVCLGVNLSPDLYPEEVKIIAFSDGYYKVNPHDLARGSSLAGEEAIMKCMTREVEKHLSRCVRRMKKVFKGYVGMDNSFLVNLYDDICYYMLMVRFHHHLTEKGYTVCLPKLTENTKAIHMQSLYNIRLAVRGEQAIVKNDFNFSAKERIYILTGPNRGGKTILTQGVGLAAYMASIGLFVAADSYEGFRFRQIFTHFPVDENTTINYGRLGEEAVRVQQIVKDSDEDTLVLLNETYSTTCASDGLYLSKDLVHVLKERNISTVFNTHIHELAKSTLEMNEWQGESDVVSIVMEIKDNQVTFRVLKREPDTTSYARNIAKKYGILYEQMMGE